MSTKTAIFLLVLLFMRSPLAADLEISPNGLKKAPNMDQLNQQRAELLSSLPMVRAKGDAEEVESTIQEIVKIEKEMQALIKPIRVNKSTPQASLESVERAPIVHREAWDVFKEF